MGKKHEVMPTQELHPQLRHALFELSGDDFRMQFDSLQTDVAQPVLYEPVFFDEDNQLVSQKMIFTPAIIKRPRAAQTAIDKVAKAIDSIDKVTNQVKFGLVEHVVESPDRPFYIDEILSTIDAQATNSARVIGGLLVVRDVETSAIALRNVYNNALMETTPTWQLRDMVLAGEYGGEGWDGVIKRDPRDVGDIAALLMVDCLMVSKKLKPALIFEPHLGMRGV